MGLSEDRIPEDKLPPCWSDDVRMNALFAPFRLKSANPESWEMKMKFWSDMLRQWCRHKNDPIITAADAKATFQRNGRTPACMDIVVEELYRNGDISPISKYQQILHNGPVGWMRWGARLAFKPAALALTAVSFLMQPKQATDSDGLPKASIDATQRFVIESVVQEQATNLIQNYPPSVERVGTVEDLMINCDWPLNQRQSFEILLGYLVSQGEALKKGDVVKIAEANTKASPITESDEALVRLVGAERRLSRDCARLARDVTAAAADAAASLKTGNRNAAKNHLRRKHKLAERAAKCEAALENVKQMLQSMREMEVNAAVVDTYRVSAQAMKAGMKEGGLDEDKVHDTMDDLKDVLDTYNSIEAALASPSVSDDLDAEDLEQELKELLASTTPPAAKGKQRAQEPASPVAPTLPSPPTSRPRVPSERDFLYDGYARVLTELDALDDEDAKRQRQARDKVPVALQDEENANKPSLKESPKSPPKPSKSWYPREDEFGISTQLDRSLERLCQGFGEIHTDERLHPGQRLDMKYTPRTNLYSTDFQVQDHKLTDRVWLYNSRDDNDNHMRTDFATSTEYCSPESPGTLSRPFQMAPGGERRRSGASTWHPEEMEQRPNDVTDLQTRLNRLRGFDL